MLPHLREDYQRRRRRRACWDSVRQTGAGVNFCLQSPIVEFAERLPHIFAVLKDHMWPRCLTAFAIMNTQSCQRSTVCSLRTLKVAQRLQQGRWCSRGGFDRNVHGGEVTTKKNLKGYARVLRNSIEQGVSPYHRVHSTRGLVEKSQTAGSMDGGTGCELCCPSAGAHAACFAATRNGPATKHRETQTCTEWSCCKVSCWLHRDSV